MRCIIDGIRASSGQIKPSLPASWPGSARPATRSRSWIPGPSPGKTNGGVRTSMDLGLGLFRYRGLTFADQRTNRVHSSEARGHNGWQISLIFRCSAAVFSLLLPLFFIRKCCDFSKLEGKWIGKPRKPTAASIGRRRSLDVSDQVHRSRGSAVCCKSAAYAAKEACGAWTTNGVARGLGKGKAACIFPANAGAPVRHSLSPRPSDAP